MKKKSWNVIFIAVIAIGVIGFGRDGVLSKSTLLENIEPMIFQIFSDNQGVAVEKNLSDQEKELIGLPFDAAKYPDNRVNVGDGKYELTEEDKTNLQEKGKDKFWVEYSRLDNLGRAGNVEALIDYEAVRSHSSAVIERPDFSSSLHIAGELKDGTFDSQDQTFRGEIRNNQILQLKGYRGYLYNKSHSLAWSLGGNMEIQNLTLGTRAQNVGKNDGKGGMAYAETIVRDAMNQDHNLKVLYKVQPLYNNQELLPRGSHVEAYSVNDNGQTVNINYWVFNAQDGVKINYSDGTWEQE